MDTLNKLKESMATMAEKGSEMFKNVTGVEPKKDLTPGGAAPEAGGKTITGGTRHRRRKGGKTRGRKQRYPKNKKHYRKTKRVV
jgi:hypothetical protein